MSAYEERVIELEELGCTTSDAQSVADCEVLDGKLAAVEDRGGRVIRDRLNRQTKTRVQVLDNRNASEEYQAADGRFETLCRCHGSAIGFETKAAAVRFASSPADWCEPCNRILKEKIAHESFMAHVREVQRLEANAARTGAR